MIPKLRDAVDRARGDEESALADAAALGLPGLAGVVAGAQDGIAVIDVERRFAYANPAACEMFGVELEQLRGRDFLDSIPAREHAMMRARFAGQLSGALAEAAAPFTCSLRGPDGREREIVYSRFAVDTAEGPLDVAFFRDLTGPRAASRAAAVLAQTASQLIGAEATGEILTSLARHAVEGTRALSCGITIVGKDHKLASAGAYGPDGPGYGEANPAWVALADVAVERVIAAMTLGAIVVGDVPGKPVVVPDARAVWEASPLTRPFAVNLSALDWRAGVFLPLSWQDRVFGFFAVFLPTGVSGPTEEELAFYRALADQAAVAVTNARLAVQAGQTAASQERARLARELHDSVSQGLFSMTLHARAAQLSMARAGLEASGALGRSVAALTELTRGALAEMRALIFELRPAVVAEEGLERKPGTASAHEAATGDPAQAGQGGTSDSRDHVAPGLGGPASLVDAAALGLPTLAAALAGAQEGIAIADAERRWVYANPAACRMLGRPLEQLRGEDFLISVPAREHEFVRGRFAELLGGVPVQFGSVLVDAEGVEHETVHSISTTEIAGIPHAVAIFRDVSGTGVAARTAAALAQAASQLVGAGRIDTILADIACHAVEGTRGLVCGISAVGDDDRLAEAGGYGPWSSGGGEVKNTGWAGFDDVPHGQVITALTGGSIVLGEAPGKPLVLPDVRAVWTKHPILEPMVVTQTDDLPGVGIFFPLSWENRVFGLFTVCLPPGLAGPSEAELAFLTALAEQAAVAVMVSRLNASARQSAALAERSRLARELHDSVNQALFSMTMHARAAQLAMARTGVDQDGALGQSIAELAQLARGAMAEMRALIFELRPAALAEEGLVAALGTQAAALSARELTTVTSQGPAERLDLSDEVEEHLYRIASEALHNVINHADAGNASVNVTQDRSELRVEVHDDGGGFDQGVAHPGHLGLYTMAERAETIGAALTVSSTPGNGTSVVLTLARDVAAAEAVNA